MLVAGLVRRLRPELFERLLGALDYHSNLELYPAWQQWLRDHQPPALRKRLAMAATNFSMAFIS